MATAKKKPAKRSAPAKKAAPAKKRAKPAVDAKAKAKAAPARKRAKPAVDAKAKAKAAPAAKAKAAPAAKAKAAPAKKAALAAKAKAALAANAKAAPAAKAKAGRTAPVVERDRSRFLHDGEHFGPASIALHTIGHLDVPSGAIVTCDPFIVDGPPLARTVTPGSYPVSLAVAHFNANGKDTDQRVAAATVHFRHGTPVRWEVATFAEAPAKTPVSLRSARASLDERAGAEPGYPVDAGTGCFMDASAQAAIKAEPTPWPTPSQKALEQQLLTDNYVHTWGWAIYRPDAASTANCVAFMSGYGDGIYSSYWGLDESGTPVCLTTDFEVFTDEDWAPAS